MCSSVVHKLGDEMIQMCADNVLYNGRQSQSIQMKCQKNYFSYLKKVSSSDEGMTPGLLICIEIPGLSIASQNALNSVCVHVIRKEFKYGESWPSCRWFVKG